MYTPDLYAIKQASMSLTNMYRAIVSYSNPNTGEIRVRIPALLGPDSEVTVSYWAREPINGVWPVPSVNAQVIVSTDDANLTNVFWVPTNPISGIQGLLGKTGYLAITTQAGNSYILTPSNVSSLIIFTSSTAVTVTVPAFSSPSTAWTVGDSIDILQKGLGQVTVSPAVGVTVSTTGLSKTRDQYSAVTLVYIDTNEWLLQGDTAVV